MNRPKRTDGKVLLYIKKEASLDLCEWILCFGCFSAACEALIRNHAAAAAVQHLSTASAVGQLHLHIRVHLPLVSHQFAPY